MDNEALRNTHERENLIEAVDILRGEVDYLFAVRTENIYVDEDLKAGKLETTYTSPTGDLCVSKMSSPGGDTISIMLGGYGDSKERDKITSLLVINEDGSIQKAKCKSEVGVDVTGANKLVNFINSLVSTMALEYQE